MKHLLPILIMFTLSTIAHADASYTLDRMIDARSGHNFEATEFSEGYAEVEDAGPYTEIEHIMVVVDSCNGIYFSPRPACEPYYLELDADTDGYWSRGEVYYLDDPSYPTLTFIRRGTLETGDAALLLFVDQIVLIFKQEL